MIYQIGDIIRGTNPEYIKNDDTRTLNWNLDSGIINEDKTDASIWDAANEKAGDNSSKSAATVMLEDYAKVIDNCYGSKNICLTEKNTQKDGWFTNLFTNNKDNLFKQDGIAQKVKDNGGLTQEDLLSLDVKQNGGLVYSDNQANRYEAALNFAKADIAGIESSYNNFADTHKKDGKLNYLELHFTNNNLDKTLTENVLFSEIDLDDDPTTFSAEEYASYLIAVDSLKIVENDYAGELSDCNSDYADGKISPKEAAASQSGSYDDKIKAEAGKIYKEHYKNNNNK